MPDRLIDTNVLVYAYDTFLKITTFFCDIMFMSGYRVRILRRGKSFELLPIPPLYAITQKGEKERIMKRASMMIEALLSGISLLFFTLVAEAQTGTIPFVSDTTWIVSDTAGTFLGSAQNVCVNASVPSNCPPGATLYGFAGGGWMADLSDIPSATWIWAPGITGETSPAFPAEFFFSKTFNLPGTPIAGTLSVAVDDFAEVFVNGLSAGTTGSVTDISLASAAQSSLIPFDVTPLLVTGANIIIVRAANGPFGCGAGPYICNPAGVVFGGSLHFVAIDIKPGSFPNSINPRSKGVIPVAILTTDTFDATTVDPLSVVFGPNGAVEAHEQGHIEDANGDGDLDLVLHFKTQNTGIQCGDTAAALTGQTFSGQAIEGSDSIVTVGCN